MSKPKKPTKSLSGPKTASKDPPPFHLIERAFAGFADGPPDARPQSRAQDLVYKAWEIPNPAKRISLAKQALAIFPDCADAYVLLAQEQAQTNEEALDLFARGVDAGARALRETYFERNAGAFWGLHQTRGYMRAQHGLARILWDSGERALAAIDRLYGAGRSARGGFICERGSTGVATDRRRTQLAEACAAGADQITNVSAPPPRSHAHAISTGSKLYSISSSQRSRSSSLASN